MFLTCLRIAHLRDFSIQRATHRLSREREVGDEFTEQDRIMRVLRLNA